MTNGAPSLIVTRYLRRPLLIANHKFDLRIFCLLTSIFPLRAYVFKEGLLRFASETYRESGELGHTQFLTNTAVHHRKTGLALDTLTWSFAEFRDYLREQGSQDNEVFRRIHDCIIRTLLAAQPAYVRMARGELQSPPYYHLLGIDVILDYKLRPRVIEVNSNPSLALTGERGSRYDTTKISMLADLLRVVYANVTASDIEVLKTDFNALDVALNDQRDHRRCVAAAFCVDALGLAQVMATLREYKATQQQGNGFTQIFPSVDKNMTSFVGRVAALIGGDGGTALSKGHELFTALKERWDRRYT